ncbi:MAG: lysylphosphatidylglycerol synthase transmembrane domain-containing protein [Alphaproteobacteria bacterium]
MKELLSKTGLLKKIAISAVILVALVFMMDTSKLRFTLDDIHNDAWAIAAGFIFVQILALSYRWLKLINFYERKITFRNAVKVNLASLLANYLFITSVGGIVVRVAMSVKSRVSLIRSIAATGLDRLFTLFALLLLTLIFLPILGQIVSTDVFHKTVFLLLLCAAGAVVLTLILFEAPRRKIIFSHRKVAMVFGYLRSVFTNTDVFARITAASLIGQLAYFAAVYTVLVSIGAEFSWLHFLAVIPVITIVASLPIGYGGWGIREGAFVYGLGFISVPIETAFAASIQIGLISMAATIMTGVPALLLTYDVRQKIVQRLKNS